MFRRIIILCTVIPMVCRGANIQSATQERRRQVVQILTKHHFLGEALTELKPFIHPALFPYLKRASSEKIPKITTGKNGEVYFEGDRRIAVDFACSGKPCIQINGSHCDLKTRYIDDMQLELQKCLAPKTASLFLPDAQAQIEILLFPIVILLLFYAAIEFLSVPLMVKNSWDFLVEKLPRTCTSFLDEIKSLKIDEHYKSVGAQSLEGQLQCAPGLTVNFKDLNGIKGEINVLSETAVCTTGPLEFGGADSMCWQFDSKGELQSVRQNAKVLTKQESDLKKLQEFRQKEMNWYRIRGVAKILSQAPICGGRCLQIFKENLIKKEIAESNSGSRQ